MPQLSTLAAVDLGLQQLPARGRPRRRRPDLSARLAARAGAAGRGPDGRQAPGRGLPGARAGRAASLRRAACAGCHRRRCARWAPTPCGWPRTARSSWRDAEAALGFPIEVVAGREEARLIYLGVAHSLPSQRRQAPGDGHRRGFHRVHHRQRLQAAPAREPVHGLRELDVEVLSHRQDQQERAQAGRARRRAWSSRRSCGSSAPGTGDEAVGSSGTARTIGEILQARGWTDGSITPDGLERLRAQLLKAGDVARLDFPASSRTASGAAGRLRHPRVGVRRAEGPAHDPGGRRDAPGHPLRHAGALPPS